MTVSPQQRILLLFIITGALSFGLAGWIFLNGLPKLSTERGEVDNRRVSIAAIQEQQSNVVRLQQQTAAIEELDQKLEQEIWTFTKEDVFFSTITGIAKNNGVTVDDPKIQDVTPTGRPLARPATIIFRGATTGLLKALADVQKTKPLIGIDAINLAPGTVGALTLNVKTIWQ